MIAQEFVPTSFDWRIGVLGGEAIFACQYRMARGHWQVVKYRDGKSQLEGGFSAIPLDRVPHGVIETAVKGANLMGDGLYGVDMKQTDKGLYVIEVNDNPDVNHGCRGRGREGPGLGEDPEVVLGPARGVKPAPVIGRRGAAPRDWARTASA